MRNLLSTAFVLGAALVPAFAAGVPAQSLTTTYAGGNSGTTTWTVQFDATVLLGPIFITAFDVNCENTRAGGVGSPFTIDVWITALNGTHVGNETNASAWTKVSTGTGVSRAMGTPTPVDVDDFLLLPGRYGIALEYTGTAMAYTNGNGTNQMYATADLRLDLGAATTGRFGTPLYTPRVWNGTVHYFAGRGTWRAFGGGCAGSAGTPVLQPAANSLPKLGTTFTLEQISLPTAVPTYLVLGVQKKTWGPLQLPLDLAAYGAPGCRLYTSLDMVLGGASVGGTATSPVPIPNDVSLTGGVVVFQGMSLQTGVNALGLVFSNAGEAYVGT